MSMTFPAPQATTRMFPDLITIQRRSVSQDSEGGEVETWANFKTSVRAQFSTGHAQINRGIGAGEMRTTAGTFVVAPARAYLFGDHGDIADEDRLVHDGVIYDIRGIERDSFAVVTGLTLEERELS